MSSARDQFREWLAELELEAYERGWNEAVAAIRGAANAMMHPTTPGAKRIGGILSGKPRQSRPRKGTIPAIVLSIVTEHPGLAGSGVVTKAKQRGNFKERSIRTGLRRLRIDGKIVRRGKNWFPAREADQVAPEKETAGKRSATPAVSPTSNQGGNHGSTLI